MSPFLLCLCRPSHSCPAAHPHCVQVSKKGLTSEEAARRLAEYGPNKLPEETRNPILVYLSVSCFLLLASEEEFLAYALHMTAGQPTAARGCAQPGPGTRGSSD